MLIYNYQKEFIGIDEKELLALGYNNLSSLKTDVSDFADLFVKTPGYIHNFQHVHWIDFITCAESYEESRVIINVKNKNYKANIMISTAFLMDNPSQKAYLVNLNNLRELTHKESELIANDIIERPLNSYEEETQNIFNTPEYSENFNAPLVEAPAAQTQSANITIDPYEETIEVTAPAQKTPKPIDMDIPLDISINDDDFISSVEPIASITPVQTSDAYTFDPSVASRELGLPLDLIEEFIEDFIMQARDFKEDIYMALDNANLDDVKISSHKLKGVAANLRIEDALEALTLVNSSSDINIIRENLDIFYRIIAKLAGEEVSLTTAPLQEEFQTQATIEPTQRVQTQDINTEEEFTLDFKDDEDDDLYSDPIEISDTDVPEKIDIAELADDTFVIPQDELSIQTPLETEDLELTSSNLSTARATISYSQEAIANEIGLDQASFATLFNDYLQDAQTLISSIKNALAQENSKTYKMDALKLKGMSDNMRINSFSSDLESIIRTTDTADIAEAINNIEADIAQLSKLGV